MKTYKDIYRFPLKKAKYGSWVYDSANNFVFQFESKFDEKGSYAKGWQEFVAKVIDTLNAEDKMALHHGKFVHENGDIFIQEDKLKTHVITIRGWGGLTGVGGHNLSSEDAANIQDTFADFIVERLNER